MGNVWYWLFGQSTAMIQASKELAITQAAARAKRRDLEERLGQRNENMTETLNRMMPGARNDRSK